MIKISFITSGTGKTIVTTNTYDCTTNTNTAPDVVIY